MSSLFGGISDFFGLDIGTTAVRLVQLKNTGGTKSLVKYAYVPVDSKIALSDSKADQQKLVQTISQLVKQARMGTNNVAVGLPSNRVFSTVADVDRLAGHDLAKAIPFQADSLIPTPLAESKIDWALLGDSPADKTKQEVLITSVTNKFVEDRLDMLETIGLNVIAFEPDNLALARALVGDETQAELIIDIGHKSTDIVVVMGAAPHLMRSVPTGTETIVKAASQNLNIDEKQAEQFVFKFGMSQDKLEGQVAKSISGTIDSLTSEIEKSLNFFNTRYNGSKVQSIIVTGGASTLPEFPLHIANKFAINVTIGNAWRNISFSQDRQNELLSVAYQFGVAAGLAERSV
ncbi:MAG TPA: type IV pilus assembly protein PilM [Candidatus Saccharimonadales bacterium]|nr:type IV pilus assembly protein PilM [Candidatus Saccharimonadales bacterium]